jgi:murein DD-endopeptidase MepM/ murein hydrolase activator NlpD
MHDYKFRQSDLSFRKPKRTYHKTLFPAAGIAAAAAALYGIVQLELPWQTTPETTETGSDIVPLALPPHTDPIESTRPPDSEDDRPAQVPTTRAFTDTMKILQGGKRQAALPKATTDIPLAASDDPAQTHAEIDAAATNQSDRGPTDEDFRIVTNENGTWIEHEVRPGDSLAKIFRDNDLSPQLLQNILRSGKAAKHLKTIRPKDRLRIHLDREQKFAELHLQLDALRSVKFSATDGGIKSTKISKQTDAMATAVSGVIDHTLFGSASKAGLPDAITMKMAKIFGWDIDFALEIRPGDRFTVIYEELWADGELVGSGNVIAAEFVNEGRSHRAIRYKDAKGKVDYYSPDGMPLKKTFFRTPVKFTRISSRFSKRRWHPVLKRARAHKGVDYAAPTGTPVIATGDATVEYRGWKKGYGRVVYLRHGRKYRTVYGHMSRFAKGLKTGSHVNQGQVIGYVGQSGLATGPHLHYEFHVDGVHRNPLAVKAPIADPLPRREMEKFRRVVRPLLASLEQTATDTMIADAR